MFLFSHTTFTEGVWCNLSSNHYNLVEDGTQNGLHLLLLSLADFMRLILTAPRKMTMLTKKDSNDDWTVSTSYNAINSYNIMGHHEILAILLFLATPGTMLSITKKQQWREWRYYKYWGKGLYFSMEMPLPSSLSQIMMTINNKYHYQNSFALWANGTKPKLMLNFTIE